MLPPRRQNWVFVKEEPLVLAFAGKAEGLGGELPYDIGKVTTPE